MDLRQLKYFVCVARLGSVTRAAEQCFVAQPAMSVAIQNLEEELGIKLFERSHKRVTLSPTGAVFLQRAEDILRRVDDSVKEMADYRDIQRGVIRIGISPMLGALLFPYILSKFHAEHPLLELIVVEEGALTLKSLLEKGELDVGIMVASEKSPQLDMLSIVKSEILACMAPGNPLVARDRIAIPRLRDQRLILFKEDTVSRRLVLQEFARHELVPDIVFSSNQIVTILRLIELGVGIGFLLKPLVQGHPGIVCRRLARPLYLEAAVVWNRNRYVASPTQAFIDAIREGRFDEMARLPDSQDSQGSPGSQKSPVPAAED